MSQCTDILAALRQGQVLTPLDALERFRCFRLAARVEELRNRGHNVRCELIDIEGKKVGRYSIPGRRA